MNRRSLITAAGLTAVIAPSDILVAMVFIGAYRQVYWASRLYG